MQNVQAALGRIHVSMEMCRLAIDYGRKRLREGNYDPVWDTEFSIVKYYIAQQAVSLGQIALNLLGGRGYLAQYAFERYVRDALGLIAGAGSLDILEIDLGIALVNQWERRRAKRGQR